MKQDSAIAATIKKFRKFFLYTGILMLSFFPACLVAQTDSAQKEKTAAPEEALLISPSMGLTGVQKSDNTIDLKASLKAKVKGSFIKLPLLKIKFFQVTDSAEKELGFVITDGEGKAIFNCKAGGLPIDKEGKLHFKAVFAGNKSMESAEEEVTFKRARLEITPVKEDSLYNVQIKLIDLGTGTETPVKEVTVGIFVHRLFYPLKIGEGTTNENGEATIEVPDKIPGDAKGNILLMAKLDENEIYGNLEASVTQQWGVPVSDIPQELPRALWSSHPPIWMLVTFFILITAVWGHYIVIVVQLFRLRKEEPHISTDATNS